MNGKFILIGLAFLLLVTGVSAWEVGDTINNNSLNQINPATINLQCQQEQHSIYWTAIFFRGSCFSLEETVDINGEIIDGNYTIIRPIGEYILPVVDLQNCYDNFSQQNCRNKVINWLTKRHGEFVLEIRVWIRTLQLISNGFQIPIIPINWNP